mgnify:CR=1 FL=1
MADKDQSDYKEYIKEKKRKYGENWKDYISSGDPGKWKQKPNIRPKERAQKTQKYKGGGMAGMRRYFRGGKV